MQRYFILLDGARYGLFFSGDGRLFIGGIIDDAIPLAPTSGRRALNVRNLQSTIPAVAKFQTNVSTMAEGEEKQWSSP